MVGNEIVISDHDGAEPAGNSAAAQNLILLGAYFEDQNFKSKATTLTQFFSNVSPMGYVLPEMLSAFILEDSGLHMLVVVGEILRKPFHSILTSFELPQVPKMTKRKTFLASQATSTFPGSSRSCSTWTSRMRSPGSPSASSRWSATPRRLTAVTTSAARCRSPMRRFWRTSLRRNICWLLLTMLRNDFPFGCWQTWCDNLWIQLKVFRLGAKLTKSSIRKFI